MGIIGQTNRPDCLLIELLEPTFYQPKWMADNWPEWMADYRPELMAKYRPEWMALNRPDWMTDNQPELMTKYRRGYVTPEVPAEILALLDQA